MNRRVHDSFIVRLIIRAERLVHAVGQYQRGTLASQGCKDTMRQFIVCDWQWFLTQELGIVSYLRYVLHASNPGAYSLRTMAFMLYQIIQNDIRYCNAWLIDFLL